MRINQNVDKIMWHISEEILQDKEDKHFQRMNDFVRGFKVLVKIEKEISFR